MIIPGGPNVSGYADLAAALRTRIGAGDPPPGHRLPAENDLAATYGVGRDTVRRAIKVLRTEGLVDYVRGWGMVVREPREFEQIRVEPGWRWRARPATAEERELYGEGVAMLQVIYPDGSGDAYPGDRTEFVT